MKPLALFLVLFSVSIAVDANEKAESSSPGVGATIKDTAKRVGHDVAESAKHTGKEIAKAGKQVGKKTAETAKSIGKKVKDDVNNKNFKPKPNSAAPKEKGDRAGNAQAVAPTAAKAPEKKKEEKADFGRE